MPIKFMVAQCNNFFRFWQLFQNLINPMIEEKLASDDEIQTHFNERKVIEKFNELQDYLLAQLTTRIFRKGLLECGQ